MTKNLWNKKISMALAALFLIFTVCTAPTIHKKGEELGSTIRTHFLEGRD